MTPRTRNLIVWGGVLAIVGLIWLLAVRRGLHFSDPVAFLIVVVGAALALTALLWWEIASDGTDTDPTEPIPPPIGEEKP